MSGSAVADAAGIGKIIIDMMVKSVWLYPRLCCRDYRCFGDDRSDHSAINSHGSLRSGFKHINWQPVFGWHYSGAADGGGIDDNECGYIAPSQFRSGRSSTADQTSASRCVQRQPY